MIFGGLKKMPPVSFVLVLIALVLSSFGTLHAETVAYTYDVDTQLLLADLGGGNSTAYTYDQAGNILSNTVAASNCAYTISPLNQTVNSGSGTGTANVTAPGSCSWTSASNASWVTIMSGSNGAGNGTVAYSVSANPSSRPRTGAIIIEGQMLSLTQNGNIPCTYTTTASNATFGGSGGSGAISINPSNSACDPAWSATSDVSWLQISSTCSGAICGGSSLSGTGSVPISFSVAANTGSTTRTGHITVLGNTITVTQAPKQACTSCGLTFGDVPATDWAYTDIYSIGCAGITQGCGAGNYCPSNYVTREQMAAFIVRAKEGESPADYCATGTDFDDVSTTDPFCPYIKRLEELQITTGCGNSDYCPSGYVSRDQMAAFIVRAVYGEPPADYCSGGSPFTDVDSSSVYCKYIKKLNELGITTGCGANTYCPSDDVPRDQMAVFLYRAFLSANCSSTISADQKLESVKPVSKGVDLSTAIGATQSPSNAGDIKVTLTWAANSDDLDAHLTGPTAQSGNRFHVYWAQANGCNSSPCDSNIPAWLNIDSSTGTETVTVLDANDAFTPGTYRFSVYDGTGNFTGSAAIVQIYQGNRLLKTYTPPAPALTQAGKQVWTVFEMNISSSNIVDIVDVGTYSVSTDAAMQKAYSMSGRPLETSAEDMRLFDSIH